MQLKYFNDSKQFLAANGIPDPVGCSEREISEIEARYGYEMPEAYREYLLWMGKDYYGVLQGTDGFFEDTYENGEDFPELFEDMPLENYELPEQYIVFFCHQGYMYGWFSIPTLDPDPICYHYFEGTTPEPITAGTFSEFINKQIISMARIHIQLVKDEKADLEERDKLKQSRKWWEFWK